MFQSTFGSGGTLLKIAYIPSKKRLQFLLGCWKVRSLAKKKRKLLTFSDLRVIIHELYVSPLAIDPMENIQFVSEDGRTKKFFHTQAPYHTILKISTEPPSSSIAGWTSAPGIVIDSTFMQFGYAEGCDDWFAYQNKKINPNGPRTHIFPFGSCFRSSMNRINEAPLPGYFLDTSRRIINNVLYEKISAAGGRNALLKMFSHEAFRREERKIIFHLQKALDNRRKEIDQLWFADPDEEMALRLQKLWSFLPPCNGIGNEVCMRALVRRIGVFS